MQCEGHKNRSKAQRVASSTGRMKKSMYGSAACAPDFLSLICINKVPRVTHNAADTTSLKHSLAAVDLTWCWILMSPSLLMRINVSFEIVRAFSNRITKETIFLSLQIGVCLPHAHLHAELNSSVEVCPPRFAQALEHHKS